MEVKEYTLCTPSKARIASLSFHILLKYLPLTEANKNQLIINDYNDGYQLPGINLSGQVIIVQSDTIAFNKAISMNKELTSYKDEHNPFFFVSFCQPIILSTLASGHCPIKPIGSINTRNVVSFHDAEFCRNPQEILKASQAGQLRYSSRFGGSELKGHRRRRGIEFDIVV